MSLTLTQAVLEKYRRDVFFETGTFEGGGAALALEAGFAKVYTCDRSPEHVARARGRFPADKVEVFQGDSRDVLRAVLPTVRGAITFWLDAHDDSPAHEPTPLLEELSLISVALGGLRGHAVLIDDMRCLGLANCWGDGLSLDALLGHIKRLDPNVEYALEDNRLAPRDILAVWGRTQSEI